MVKILLAEEHGRTNKAAPVSLDMSAAPSTQQPDAESASHISALPLISGEQSHVAHCAQATSCPLYNQLKDRYQISTGTANHAIAELKTEGLAIASRGCRAIVGSARIQGVPASPTQTPQRTAT